MSSFRNALLRALSPPQIEFLRPHLERVPLVAQETLIEAAVPIRHAYFVESGMLSLGSGKTPRRAGIGVIGREGLAGLSVILGVTEMPFATIVQLEGEAY